MTAPKALVHPIVVLLKKCGGIRITVDFCFLNDNIIRPRFESLRFRLFALSRKACGSSPLSTQYGFHQVPLDDESSAFGRFQYVRLPMGITHAGDDFGRRGSDVFDDNQNTRRLVEDILIFSSTYEEHMEIVRQVLARAEKHSISLYSNNFSKNGGYHSYGSIVPSFPSV